MLFLFFLSFVLIFYAIKSVPVPIFFEIHHSIWKLKKLNQAKIFLLHILKLKYFWYNFRFIFISLLPKNYNKIWYRKTDFSCWKKISFWLNKTRIIWIYHLYCQLDYKVRMLYFVLLAIVFIILCELI